MIPVPEEIWHQIFSSYECVLNEEWWMYEDRIDHSSRKTLRSLCLVSTQFRRLAQPLLYRSIPHEGYFPDNERYQGKLARTLTASPELGLHTRAVSLEEQYLQIDHDLRDNVLLQHLPSLVLPPAVRRHIKDELESFDHSFHHFTSIGIAPFIIALTPRVRLVDLTYLSSEALLWQISGRADLAEQSVRKPGVPQEDEAGGEPRERAILHAGAPYSNFGLPNLQEVRLRTGDYDCGTTPIDFIEPALLHPGLRTLRLLGTKWLRKNLELLRWPGAPRGVRHLELREAIVDASSFRHILARFTGLRTLLVYLVKASWRLHATFPGDEPVWDVRLEEIGSALRASGSGLEALDLHTNDYLDHPEGPARFGAALGSLREMRSLRRLSVVYDNLVGGGSTEAPEQAAPAILAELLPPSLETLHLHWDERYPDEESYRQQCAPVNSAVRVLLEHGGMPSLRQVSMERRYSGTLDGEFDGPVAGWDMTAEKKRPWRTSGCASRGFERTIVTFKKRM